MVTQVQFSKVKPGQTFWRKSKNEKFEDMCIRTIRPKFSHDSNCFFLGTIGKDRLRDPEHYEALPNMYHVPYFEVVEVLTEEYEMLTLPEMEHKSC